MKEVESISIVIPAWNELLRLPRAIRLLEQAIKTGDLGQVRVVEVIVVDDGSTDGTAIAAVPYARDLPGFKIITHPQNLGRGAAVRSGVSASVGQWILIADADQSTPWYELRGLYGAAKAQGAQIAIGSRRLRKQGQRISNQFPRRAARMFFNWALRALTWVPIRDTQCGFKLFKRSAIELIFPRMVENGYAWDLECLVLAQAAGIQVVEVAVDWRENPERRVRLMRDGVRVLGRALRMRERARTQGSHGKVIGLPGRSAAAKN